MAAPAAAAAAVPASWEDAPHNSLLEAPGDAARRLTQDLLAEPQPPMVEAVAEALAGLDLRRAHAAERVAQEVGGPWE